jgi:translation initiation factor RLI1
LPSSYPDPRTAATCAQSSSQKDTQAHSLLSHSIAIVNSDKCKPKKCRQECKKSCPVVKTGKLCIEVDNASKIAFISERLCIGCGICPKKCPFDAIQIINLPTNLESQVTHRYSANSFKLHRLPMPRPGQVLGLVGTNGIGKSTALKILAGKLKPNLGRFEDPPDWEEILRYFRGSELQSKNIRDLDIREEQALRKLQTTSQKFSRTTSRPSPSRSTSTRFRRLSRRRPTDQSAT